MSSITIRWNILNHENYEQQAVWIITVGFKFLSVSAHHASKSPSPVRISFVENVRRNLRTSLEPLLSDGQVPSCFAKAATTGIENG